MVPQRTQLKLNPRHISGRRQRPPPKKRWPTAPLLALALIIMVYLPMHWFSSEYHAGSSNPSSLLFNFNQSHQSGRQTSVISKTLQARQQLTFKKATALVNPLTYNQTTGCYDWRPPVQPTFTQANQTHIRQNQRSRGLVVTLVLGKSPENFLCRFFPSQLQHLIIPQQWDVLFVVADKSTVGSNKSKNKKRPTSRDANHLKHELISCLNLTQYSTKNQTWYNLDGSILQTQEYRVQLKTDNNETVVLQPRIFLAEMDLNLPKYIQANPSLLSVPMEPKQCQAPIPYIQGTKWYVDEMLQLGILKHYDYFIKLDRDVVFRKPVSIDLLYDMNVRGAVFAHTGEYSSHIEAPCGKGITRAMQDFSLQQSPKRPHNYPIIINNQLCRRDHPKLNKDADLYYTNFIIGRTDFFQSQLVLQFSRFLAEYPQGFFRYRWTDQIFWHFAMGLIIDGNFENAVVDYSEFRCAPIRNCWMSVHQYRQDRCDNDGAFFHTKAKVPNENPEWTWKEYLDARDFAPAKISLPQRNHAPYETQYEDQCQGLHM